MLSLQQTVLKEQPQELLSALVTGLSWVCQFVCYHINSTFIECDCKGSVAHLAYGLETGKTPIAREIEHFVHLSK